MIGMIEKIFEWGQQNGFYIRREQAEEIIKIAVDNLLDNVLPEDIIDAMLDNKPTRLEEEL